MTALRARGLARHLAPETRLLTAALLLVSVGVAPTTSALGLGALAAAPLAWGLLTLPQRRVVIAASLAGLAALLPYLLLALLAPREERARTLATAAGLVARGMASLLVSVATAASLPRAELGDALARLPLPTGIAALLLELAQQTAVLGQEARGVLLALRLRGGALGPRASLSLAAAWPRVFLPRLVERAERRALAMELRGYDGRPVALAEHRRSLADSLALGLGVGWLALCAALRLAGAP